MSFAIRPVDPARDAGLLHSSVNQERAVYWGMVGKERSEVEAIHSSIREQPHLAGYLVNDGDAPLALFQTYDPAVDEIGRHYVRQHGEVGVHLFLAEDPRPAGLTRPMLDWFLGWLLADPRHERIVAEPEVRNTRSVQLFVALGAELGPVVQLTHKRAQLTFLTGEALLSR